MPLNIYNASFFQRLRDAFDIKGKHNFLLDEVMVPVVVVQDLSTEISSEPVDATYQMVVAAAAGLNSSAVLSNDAGSGWTILIDRVTYSANATGRCGIILTTVAPVTPNPGGSADKAWNDATLPSTPPGTMFGDGAAAWAGDSVYEHQFLPNTPYVVQPKLVLQPGQEIAVQNFTQNVTFRVTLNARVIRIL